MNDFYFVQDLWILYSYFLESINIEFWHWFLFLLFFLLLFWVYLLFIFHFMFFLFLFIMYSIILFFRLNFFILVLLFLDLGNRFIPIILNNTALFTEIRLFLKLFPNIPFNLILQNNIPFKRLSFDCFGHTFIEILSIRI